MIKFAVIDSNNIVTNTIVADSIEIAEQATQSTCIEIPEGTPVSPGSIWNGVNFFDPVIEEPTE
jgi:hypothetical protein